MKNFYWFKNQFENNLSYDEQVDVFNRYCDINGIDEHIYPMSDINEFFKNCTPLEILRNVSGCDFIAGDNYFSLVKGNVVSFCDPYWLVSAYPYDIYKCKKCWEDYLEKNME